MRKGKFLFLTMALGALLLAGCTSRLEADAGIQQLNERIAAFEVQLRNLQEENSAMKSEARTLRTEKAALEGELDALKDMEKVKEPGGSAAVEYYPVYAMDVDSMQRVTISFVGVERTRNLAGRLEEVARALSGEVFEGLIISLKGITTVEGKKVATFNLRDVPGVGKSWGESYFQGSTGGSATVMALMDTLLQGDYRGTWIDGVRFLYEDEVIAYEHVESMEGIFFRK